MLKKSASWLKFKAQAKAEMKNITSSLNLNLSLSRSLRHRLTPLKSLCYGQPLCIRTVSERVPLWRLKKI